MCGVVGILDLHNGAVAPAILQRMTDALAHRGPDGSGIYTDGPVGLGHRRLAIIDLSPAADQPMVTPDRRFALSYNGELYNFRELRAELAALGWQFRSQGDAEVVLYALAQWGADAVARFNGMFALALWDRERRELLLARDRFGVKPLYYALVGRAFLFGSESKAFLGHPEFVPAMDLEALVEYVTFQNFFTDRTLFRGVRLLPAGCTMRVAADADSVPVPRRYWDFTFREPDNAADPEASLDALDGLFRQAVGRQLIADVPINAYLSGGMDSGSITAIAAAQLPYLRTFTVGFDLSSASGLEMGFDEREKAEHMSYRFKTEHYEMVLKAGDMERTMRELVWHLEEPRVGQSYPNYYAAKLASRFGKVVLSGAGGDELFGGYPWRYYRAVVNDSFEHYIDKYFDFWQRIVPQAELERVLQPVWPDARHVLTRDIFRGVFARHAPQLTRPADYVNHSLYFEAKTFLHGLLVVEDKLSMAHGLETRVPFLDNDLVDFAQQVPVGLKLGNLDAIVELNENEPGPKTLRYYEKTRDGKLLLRQMMARYVPNGIANGIKQGFSAPDASWFRGDSIDYVRRMLYDGNPRIYDYFDRTATQALVDEHLSGQRNRRLLIWSLLNLETWCRLFLDGERP